MKEQKTNKGITLIALIITIIVLLILAVVSIRLVVNNGILGKAESAVNKYSDSEINEKIQLAYSELRMEQVSNPNVDAEAFLKTSLEKQGLTEVNVRESDGAGWKVTYDGKVYQIEANGTVGEGIEVGKVKYGNQILGVGDQVNYDPTLNATGDTTYSSPASATGADSAQAFDAATYKNAGFSWRVLDVKNGQVRLIADTDVGPGDYSENATSYYLYGQAGYINGKNELNTICGIFGHGKGAASATSITVNDINAITGYNPKSPRYNQGNWGEYESEVTYTRGDGSALSSCAKLKSTKNPLTWNGTQNTFKYYNGTEFVDLTGSTTITSMYYDKNYNDDARKTGVLNADGTFSAPYEILFGKYKYDVSNNYDRSFSGTREHSYWLASDYVYADDNSADWGLRFVGGAGVRSNGLYYSYGRESGGGNGVRPVVSLKSDVQLKWNDTANEWQIQ